MTALSRMTDSSNGCRPWAIDDAAGHADITAAHTGDTDQTHVVREAGVGEGVEDPADQSAQTVGPQACRQLRLVDLLAGDVEREWQHRVEPTGLGNIVKARFPGGHCHGVGIAVHTRWARGDAAQTVYTFFKNVYASCPLKNSAPTVGAVTPGQRDPPAGRGATVHVQNVGAEVAHGNSLLGIPVICGVDVCENDNKVYTLLDCAVKFDCHLESFTMATTKSRLKLIDPNAVAPPSSAINMADRIVASITGAIVERRLVPGTKLAEQKIADIFKVSRTIVRQALIQLGRGRLVTLEKAHGAYVAMPSIEEARQVFEMRNMVESAMVRQLCARITDAQVAQLKAHLVQERQAVKRGDVAMRTRLLADFHVVLAQLLGNDVLAESLRDLLNRSQLISLMFQSSHSADESQREHELVVDAIERRDASAAARLMTNHITSVESNLRTDPQAADLSQILRNPD